MTEQLEAIDDAPEMVADNDSEQTEVAQEVSDIEATESNEAQDDAPEEGDNLDESGNVKFPKKAVHALRYKNKQIFKLRTKLREIEEQLNQPFEGSETKDVNPNDFESYGDYINAKVESLVEQRIKQSQGDMHKQQMTHQQQALLEQRDQYIREQAQEVSKTFTDLPQVWEQNAQLLDALPKEIADIFFNIDNAPAAVYTLAKEGKLEGLLYANPAIAAYEIVNAQNRGLERLSRPHNNVSQAPTPITKAKGTGSVKKQLSPNDDVLKSLGLKK
jgi:hypothetical protein